MKSGVAFSEIAPDELERLLSLKHHDPHSILGPHLLADGVVVRSYRPGAERMQLVINGARSFSMIQRPDAEGLFEVAVNNRRKVFPYQLEVTYPGNLTYTIRSPYSFSPSLGELDLFLLGEQKHERLYDKM